MASKPRHGGGRFGRRSDQQGRHGDVGERPKNNAGTRRGGGRGAEVASPTAAGDCASVNQSILHDEDSGIALAQAGCRVVQAHVSSSLSGARRSSGRMATHPSQAISRTMRAKGSSVVGISQPSGKIQPATRRRENSKPSSIAHAVACGTRLPSGRSCAVVERHGVLRLGEKQPSLDQHADARAQTSQDCR
jgi:hypothetical protein